MLTVRQAHNVLAAIAHKVPLDGDQRNVVTEANRVLVEFILANEKTTDVENVPVKMAGRDATPEELNRLGKLSSKAKR